ncbi:(Fe-S)-binding protein [Chloroflexota bacterium]
MAKKKLAINDISKNPDQQLMDIQQKDLMALPFDCDSPCEGSAIKPMSDAQRERYECSLDGISVVNIPKAKNKEEEQRVVDSFLSGLRKSLAQDDNWTFWQQLMLTLDACVRCQTCNDACPIYISSGKQDYFRPTYRSELLRKIKEKYLDRGGSFMTKLRGNDIELNYATVVRLAELAYRCTMCRRCAKWCPMGSDNALVTRELRKIFSQELGWAPPELHEKGTVKQLQVGASTGISPDAFMGMVEFMEEEIEEKTGKKIKIPVDKKGAEILLIHNTGEYMSWMENPEAFAIIFDAAGVDYTLSSQVGGYEGTNYGAFYSDPQFARIAVSWIGAAKELGVKKIMAGECGHEHKSLVSIADRLLVGDTNVPRESCFPLLKEIVFSGKLKLDPQRNNFPVTLHDPCNFVRLMGIVEPQREILRYIAPKFREMTPHGVDNYCCGGGSGFAIFQNMNFPEWRYRLSNRMKMKQVLEAFGDDISPDTKKLVCAPCSNCKGAMRDMFAFYNAGPKYGIGYTGLVEFIVNAMVDMPEPFIDLDELVMQ